MNKIIDWILKLSYSFLFAPMIYTTVQEISTTLVVKISTFHFRYFIQTENFYVC